MDDKASPSKSTIALFAVFVTMLWLPQLNFVPQRCVVYQTRDGQWLSCQGASGIATVQPFQNCWPLIVNPMSAQHKILERLECQWTEIFTWKFFISVGRCGLHRSYWSLFWPLVLGIVRIVRLQRSVSNKSWCIIICRRLPHMLAHRTSEVVVQYRLRPSWLCGNNPGIWTNANSFLCVLGSIPTFQHTAAPESGVLYYSTLPTITVVSTSVLLKCSDSSSYL